MAEYKGAASEAGRVQQLIKRREKQKQQIEKLKQKIEQDNVTAIQHINAKFSSHYDAVEQQLKTNTVGLVTLDEMKAKRDNLVKEREQQLANAASEQSQARKNKKKKRRNQAAALSFQFEDDEVDDDGEEVIKKAVDSDEEISKAIKKKRIRKNPDVDTSFLPDRDREEEERKKREALRQEWSTKQEALKDEQIEITYSYWDGSGHRRSSKNKKGDTIQHFLMKCLETLRKDFHELKAVSVEQMMYIKEDLIIPHHHSFYDFIVTKARGKSGPLFNFDVHDDIRLVNDASKEKDESHAGKVVLRNWYERNKHIFPASRWEPYDPEKKWNKYTIK